MTNFEKIIEGGPEALVRYSTQSRCRSCIYRCNEEQVSLNNKKCQHGNLEWLSKAVLTAEETGFVHQALDFGLEWVQKDLDGFVRLFKENPEESFEEEPIIYKGKANIGFVTEIPTYLPGLML